MRSNLQYFEWLTECRDSNKCQYMWIFVKGTYSNIFNPAPSNKLEYEIGFFLGTPPGVTGTDATGETITRRFQVTNITSNASERV
jgi:hypothetical protein